MINRIQNLANAMNDNFEGAIIKQPSNLFYFTGLDTHDAGLLIILPKKAYFIIDSRYIEIAKNTVKFAEVILQNNEFEQMAQILKEHEVKRVNIEDSCTLAYARKVRGALGSDIAVDDTDELSKAVAKLRVVKSEDEIDKIKRAQVITDACFTHIQKYIKPGVKETDIALEMEMFMRKNGASGLAFSTILVAGTKSSLPHGEPGDNTIKNGDFVTMDFGAKVEGYCTDMTRTVAVQQVSDEQKKVYEIVLKAQLAACNYARAGLKGSDVDKIARDIIAAEGYADYFGHGLGHSLGIDVHEDPRYSPTCHDIIPENALMTIEPGIYLPSKFGVRIEDTVLVKKDGIEILGKSDKNLVII